MRVLELADLQTVTTIDELFGAALARWKAAMYMRDYALAAVAYQEVIRSNEFHQLDYVFRAHAYHDSATAYLYSGAVSEAIPLFYEAWLQFPEKGRARAVEWTLMVVLEFLEHPQHVRFDKTALVELGRTVLIQGSHRAKDLWRQIELKLKL